MRATSPGAEIRDAQRAAAAQKEAEEKRKRALYSSPAPQSVQQAPSAPGSHPATSDQRPKSATSHAQSVRRFQISRPGGIGHGQSHSFGGIQKRRADGSAPGVAVLVEQLRRKPHSRQASMVAELVGRVEADGKSERVTVSPSDLQGTSTPKPRKRPVVNQAERQWRQEQQGSMSAAKERFSELLEKSAQARESTAAEYEEHLAREFEQVALEIEQDMEVDDRSADKAVPSQTSPSKSISVIKKPSKFQPRSPKKPRVVPVQQAPAEAEKPNAIVHVEDSEDDYVYDVYIRRPLADMDNLRNPLTEHESEQIKEAQAMNSGVGVIVITPEDEDIWEHFVEDDEEEWDSEDADSNGEYWDPLDFRRRPPPLPCTRRTKTGLLISFPAEDNPANDYPDEDLSSDDEEDDPTAIYSKYRRHAMSDDDEFDFDDSDNDSGARLRSGFEHRGGFGGRENSDDDST